MNVGYYIPRYELFVRTQNIFNGSTMASAWMGAMSTSHHSSIVAQYHHSRTKLSILAMDVVASTANANFDVVVDNGFFIVVVAVALISSLFAIIAFAVARAVIAVAGAAAMVAVVVVVVVTVVDSMKNN